MPHIQTQAQAISIVSIATCDITVASAADLYAGMVGIIVGPGGSPQGTKFKIIQKPSSAVIRCRATPDGSSGDFSSGSDFTAFAGGTLYFEKQLAYVEEETGQAGIATQIQETGGPTDLDVGAIPDLNFMFRSGSAVTGVPFANSGEVSTTKPVRADDARLSGTGTGDMLKGIYDADNDGAVDVAGGGTGAKTAAAAFGNIKQAASTTATGVVELATDGETLANVVVQGNDARLSNSRTPSAHAASHQNGADEIATITPAINAIPKTNGTLTTLPIGWVPLGTSSSTACVGNDSRLSDARAPTAHNHAATEITSGVLAADRLATGTGLQVLRRNTGNTALEFVTILASDPVPASGAVPAFVANAATVAPGTDELCEYVLTEGRTLAAASVLTLATTGTPVLGDKMISCYALSLGYALSVANGGGTPATIGTIPASLTKPLALVVRWDGTNYTFGQYIHLKARL